MKTVICAEFNQESNRYAKGVSGVKEYRDRRYIFDGEAVRKTYMGTKSEMGGFFDVLDNEPECRLVPVLSLCASPGPVTAQAVWQQVHDALLQAIGAEPSVDGVLLALHGAMVTEEMEDGEGALLQAIRQKVGPDVPIIASLDLHANMTVQMMENATAFFPCDYYPHTDTYEAAVRAARCMWDTLTGKRSPVMKWNKLDLIFPYVPTAWKHFAPLLQKAQAWRNSGTLLDAAICHGFFAGDIYEQGAAVLTVSDGDPDLAQRLADELAADVWEVRDLLNRPFYTPQEAIKLALQEKQWPAVLADVADNPGSGASADSVVLLKNLLEAGAEDAALAILYDPQVAEQAHRAGEGAVIEIELGGKVAPEITGGPLHCTAVVQKLTDGCYQNRDRMNQGVTVLLGDSALLKIGGVHVIVTSRRSQPYDLEVYRHCGIQPEDMKLLVVKSAAHYRASYGRIAKAIYDVETPALGPMRPQALPLAHSRRPIYPLDEL